MGYGFTLYYVLLVFDDDAGLAVKIVLGFVARRTRLTFADCDVLWLMLPGK